MRFEELTRRPDAEIDLATAALLVAADAYPELELEPWLERLDHLGEELRGRLEGLDSDFDQLQELKGYLFEELGFRGNTEDYYDPRNSFLNDVLERRLGIPLSLGVLAIAVGERAGVPLLGIGFPGHFLIRHAHHPELFLDPFEGGRFLTDPECAEILDRVSGGRMVFDRELLRPIPARQVIQRMLLNLRSIYLHREELHRAMGVLDRLVQLEPDRPRHKRDRGILRVHCSDPRGIEDLESYLEALPEASDRQEIEKVLKEARQRLASPH